MLGGICNVSIMPWLFLSSYHPFLYCRSHIKLRYTWYTVPNYKNFSASIECGLAATILALARIVALRSYVVILED